MAAFGAFLAWACYLLVTRWEEWWDAAPVIAGLALGGAGTGLWLYAGFVRRYRVFGWSRRTIRVFYFLLIPLATIGIFPPYYGWRPAALFCAAFVAALFAMIIPGSIAGYRLRRRDPAAAEEAYQASQRLLG